MSLILDGTSGLSDVDGTAAAPAIRGTDTNTGIFFPAADTIAFSEGGVEAARIDASGNVGIGTSLPAAKLESLVTSTSTPALRLRYNAVSYYFDASMDNNGNTVFMVPAANGVTSGNLLFGAGGAERARIDASGNLLVNTTSNLSTRSSNPKTFINAGGADTLALQIASNNNFNLYSYVTTTSGTRYHCGFGDGTNNNIGNISSNGTAVAYNTSSDYRLKEAIAPMTGALAKVALLKPCTYKWKVDGSDGQGFIAHELAEVEAKCVTGEKDAVDADGNPQYQGIDTSFLVATLAAAIQELKAIVDGQAVEIAALKGAV